MSFYDWLDLIWYFFALLILVPIGTGLWHWKRLKHAERNIVFFLTALLILECVATYFRYQVVRNHFINYLRTIVVLWIGAVAFYPVGNRARLAWLLALIIALVIPFEVYLWVGFNHINSVTRAIAWLLLILYAFFELKQLINQSIVSLRNNSFAYYYSGFLILGFFSAAFGVMESYFIETSLDLYYFADTLLIIVSSVSYMLFAIGLSRTNQ